MNSEPSRKFATSPKFTIEPRRQRDALRPYLCATFLLFQVVLLTYHRFSPGRLNRLTPFSGQTSYHVGGIVNDLPLRADDVRERYGLEARGIIAGNPDDLRKILSHRELRGDDEETVYLRLHTRYNGGPEEVWLWPQL